MMSYVRKHRPMVVIAEKVKGITQRIDDEDLINQVADTMNDGYHFAYRLLNTSHFIPKAVIAGWWVSVFMNASADVEIFDIKLMKTKSQEVGARWHGPGMGLACPKTAV